MLRKAEWLMVAVTAAICACTPGDGSIAEQSGTTAAQERSAHEVAERPHIVTPSGQEIELEVARTDQQRARGLMFRESLPPAHGMLFIFSVSEQHGFWMKNTFIALDLLWLERDGTIAEIQRDIQPCGSDPCPTYAPDSPGLYVLELAAGEADRLGLSEGDRLMLRNIDGPTGG